MLIFSPLKLQDAPASKPKPQRESHQGSVMPLIIQFRHLIASICACYVAASASAYLLSSVWIWLISQMLSISGKYVISSATSLNRTFRFMTFTSGEWTNIFFSSQRSLNTIYKRKSSLPSLRCFCNTLICLLFYQIGL